MAAHYLADLRAHQPAGPYLLGGYCFGGVVAYEIARQLEAQGEKVGFLALINCTAPQSSYDQPGNRWSPVWQFKFWCNILYWVGCFLFRWSLRERREFLSWKFSAFCRKAKAAEPLLGGGSAEFCVGDVNDLPVAEEYSDQQRELWQLHVRSLLKYHPKPYGGRATLFRTRGHSVISSFDEQFGWGELVPNGVDVKYMPGGHGNILDEPHVGSVATAFRACLPNVPAKGAA
jgi:thioesterase domain-containing protein